MRMCSTFQDLKCKQIKWDVVITIRKKDRVGGQKHHVEKCAEIARAEIRRYAFVVV